MKARRRPFPTIAAFRKAYRQLASLGVAPTRGKWLRVFPTRIDDPEGHVIRGEVLCCPLTAIWWTRPRMRQATQSLAVLEKRIARWAKRQYGARSAAYQHGRATRRSLFR